MLTGLIAFPPLPLAKEKPPTTYKIPLPPVPDFAALEWVMGGWSGKTIDHDPPGDIQLRVAYELDKRVAVFRETVSLPATKAIPGMNESWMGILTATSGSPFILRVFTSTGFVTRYQLAVENAELHFTPDGGDHPPPGWLFRRVLARTDVDAMTETVEAAPPDKAFFVFYTAKLARAKAKAAKQ